MSCLDECFRSGATPFGHDHINTIFQQAETVNTPEGKSLCISITLDGDTIKPRADGAVTVQEMFAEQDAQGNFVAKIRDDAKLIWPPGQSKVRYQRTLPLRPGAVSVRLVVRDATSGRSGSLSIPLANIPS